MAEITAPATTRPSALGVLWRGHVFLFDKEREPATFGDTAGIRLLLIVTGLEIIRLLRNQFLLRFLPFWLEVPIYLAMVLAATRFVAAVGLGQIGFSRWTQWNATERSYFIQVLILVNVVFPLLFGARLRAALAEPSIVWTAFVPYLVYGFYQEVLYRGMLQTELVRRWGPTAGILVSNVLYTFGPPHYYYFFSEASLAVPMFASIFAIGLLFAIVFHRTGNLWIVAIMHAFGNSYAVGAFGRIR
jgi:membrane protease YdiL (CAAX protease family)